MQEFSRGGDFCNGGGLTIHCLITKIWDLKEPASYIYSYVLAQKEGD